MKMLFNQDSYVKKGISKFSNKIQANQVFTTTGTKAKVFGKTKYTNSERVYPLDEERLFVKANTKVNIRVQLAPTNFGTANSSVNFQLYANDSAIGENNFLIPVTSTTLSNIKPIIELDYTALIDTIIDLRSMSITGQVELYFLEEFNTVRVEELEAYLTPIPRIDFDETVIKQASQNISIVPNLPVGYEKVIRKDFATQGVCDITFMDTNEKFGIGGYSKLSLNFNGDYFRIKKVSATNWIILEENEEPNIVTVTLGSLALEYINCIKFGREIHVQGRITPINNSENIIFSLPNYLSMYNTQMQILNVQQGFMYMGNGTAKASSQTNTGTYFSGIIKLSY